MNTTAFNSTTEPYYLEDSFGGMIGAAISLGILVIPLCASIVLFVGHETYKLPILLLQYCFKRAAYEENTLKTKTALHLFCLHLLVFCTLRYIYMILRLLSFVLTRARVDIRTLDAIIGIELIIICFGFGQFITLISQVVHIWLRVIQVIDSENRFKSWFYYIIYTLLVIANVVGYASTMSVGAFYAIPTRILSEQKKLLPSLIVAVFYCIALVGLTLMVLVFGAFIIFTLSSSLKISANQEKKLAMVRISAFIVVFVICANVEMVGLFISTVIPTWTTPIIFQSVPEAILVSVVCIVFWPNFSWCCVVKVDNKTAEPQKVVN